MKRLILALAVLLALTGTAACDEPQPSPQAPTAERETVEMDSIQYHMRQNLEATRTKIDLAWRQQAGYYVCTASTNLCWNAILIYDGQGNLSVRLYTQWKGCPDPGNTGTTCHEGASLNDPSPIGSCTTREYWLDLVDQFLDVSWPAGSYKVGPTYTGWYAYEVDPFGPSDMKLTWDYQLPGGPTSGCTIPEYLDPTPPPPTRTKRKFHTLSETGRGEQ